MGLRRGAADSAGLTRLALIAPKMLWILLGAPLLLLEARPPKSILMLLLLLLLLSQPLRLQVIVVLQVLILVHKLSRLRLMEAVMLGIGEARR